MWTARCVHFEMERKIIFSLLTPKDSGIAFANKVLDNQDAIQGGKPTDRASKL